MVPNHVGIDGDWVMNHPDWFIQVSSPPFPAYRFGGTDLSENPGVGVFIEEGYWSKTDAAVVFRRHDRATGQDRFIYHGNDGTSMPWNDTAQLDYSKAEVRHAVIETILHVARMFPIIRFDAAMTLAKRHVQRLWFPLPGQGGAIPSRSDHAMTQEELDRAMPVEFWREVVDAVAARAPDTLLLAEAFWMMEGYFVRTLGMHRVYNSAFMNMLKREENQKYRDTIKNVLAFDPEVLKRFVNFMSNPDEETAVAQFGGDDKYFGVCVLMCTMPGLPMFGHGQIEGFHEKYGMEYRRPKWDEHPNQGLVERHEREIFPLAKKRYLFSGVTEFALYDFVAEGGGVDEDVFAYSNAYGGERALVLYNNKWKDTRGRLHGSIGTGSKPSRGVGDALGLTGAHGEWVLFRDMAKGLEYIRPMNELRGSFYWELGAFKYHVLHEFRGVSATAERPYDQLARELGGRGVPSIERALVEMKFRPVHVPVRETLGSGHVAYLLAGWDAEKEAPTQAALDALEERLRHVAAGLAYMKGGTAEAEAEAEAEARSQPAAFARSANAPLAEGDGRGGGSRAERVRGALGPHEKTAHRRFAAVMAMAHARAEDPKSGYALGKEAPDARLLVTWLELEAVVEMIATQESGAPSREQIVTAWELAMPLVRALEEEEGHAHERAALVLLALTLPTTPLRATLKAALDDPRGRAFLGVHESGGVVWLGKEAFERLARFLAERDVVDGRVSMALAEREVLDAARVAEEAGYKVDAVARGLDDKTAKDATKSAPAASPEGSTGLKSSS